MKIGLISDSLTHECLTRVAEVVPITSANYIWNLWYRKPDLLFVESAWKGRANSWKYKIASYPDVPKRNNDSLEKVVRYARKMKIPTVFWNKEDGVHFQRFIKSAELFDYIFTVDENSVARYKDVVSSETAVNVLMFAVEPSLHRFTGFDFQYRKANFVGSYSSHIHHARRLWQEMLFRACAYSQLDVVAFDRNSDRRSSSYRYPCIPGLSVRPAVSYDGTAKIYKDFLVSLNVNTIENSPTMFSRRLVEVIACGGIAVTTPSLAVDKLFKDYCHVVSGSEESVEILTRLKKDGPSAEDLERARAGAEYVAKNHTWKQRLKRIYEVIGL